MDINERAYWEDWGDEDDDEPPEPNWEEIVDELHGDFQVAQARAEAAETKLKEAERLTRSAQEDAVRLAQRKAELSDLVAASWGGRYEQEVYDALHAQIAALREKVQELEAQLAAQAWRPVTEPPKNKDYSELFLWCDTQETAGGVGVIKFDGWFFNPVNYKPIERGYYMPIPPAPPQDTQIVADEGEE